MNGVKMPLTERTLFGYVGEQSERDLDLCQRSEQEGGDNIGTKCY